jgi:hypothetical protein
LKSIRKKKQYFVIISGLALFLGTLCKGIVAFFPWTFPFLIWLFSKRIPFKQVVIDTFILVIATLLPLILLYFSLADAKLFFDTYLSEQLFSSVTGLRGTTESRFFIIKSLWKNSIICLILAAGIFVVQMVKKKTNLLNEQRKNMFVFFSLSLCGILPVMLSLKQSGYYIIPAYPFLAIAFALPFQAFIKEWQGKINSSSRGFLVFKIISCVIVIAVIVFSFSQKGNIGRDKKNVQLIFECSKYIPENTIISIDKEMYAEWGLHAYFVRHKNISLDKENAHLFYLHNQDLPLPQDEEYVHLTDIENFSLYKKICNNQPNNQ